MVSNRNLSFFQGVSVSSGINSKIIQITSSFLSTADVTATLKACHRSNSLFKHSLAERKAKKLLTHVQDADPQKTKKLLETLPREVECDECIVLIRTSVTEKNGRAWRNISALEFAVWAGEYGDLADKPENMLSILLAHVPDRYRAEAVAQLQGMKKREETVENGEYLAPYKAFIKKCESHVTQFDALFHKRNIPELERLWLDGMGSKMEWALLPMVGLQQFYHQETFEPLYLASSYPPLPTFNYPAKRDPELPSPQIIRALHFLLLSDKIANQFALHKGPRGNAAVPHARGVIATNGIATMRHFCQVRSTMLDNLILQLQSRDDKMEKKASCVIS